jgi:hypothetical protein
MNDAEGPENDRKDEGDNHSSQGPSLTLLYSLIGLALALAIAVAALIVLPFYRHR